VDPRAGLYDVDKRKYFTLPGLDLRPHSQSKYRLRYPGSSWRSSFRIFTQIAALCSKPCHLTGRCNNSLFDGEMRGRNLSHVNDKRKEKGAKDVGTRERKKGRRM
jgi:hypothetical protein